MRRAVRRPQRAIVLRVARAYRDNSYAAASLLAGSPPWDLEAKWREEAREVLFERLEIRELAGNQKEAAAVRPVLKEWVERKYGAPSFHLTQLLTGHGCFGWYLCERVGREPTTACHHCDRRAVDTAQHTREECPAWDEPRAALFTVIGGDLSLPALIRHMLSSEEEWEAVTTFSVVVMTQKEAAEKVRELSAAEGQAGGEESSQRD
ncbi:uncharacterized protein LOC125232725 [Leguminivora glycinivorella]|uniref:uncharacterized protein LOC125232725 n=1 Tax=Leguminivora glycinivorella TaxID=1035111 RepID=UPI00200D01D8|nr:uncharacterized protein LOC125232725 [Leguminivora glycinivorella]